MAGDAAPFVDTHVHFWDLAHAELTYGWLQPGVRHPILGDIEGVKQQRFDAAHLLAESRFAGAEAFVHVQAAVGTADPVAETRWITEMAAEFGQPSALVAHADLADSGVERMLDEHLVSLLMRGVRDFAVEQALAAGKDERLDAGLRALSERGLILDLDCEWPQMAAAAKMADRHPDLTIVLEHLGYPRSREDDYFAGWRQGMRALAAAPNVYCKISGIGMGDPTWSAGSIAPWVASCIETFSPSRCMLGTNWPVDRLFSSYDAIVSAYRRCLAGLSDAEQSLVLRLNATAVYGL